MLLRVDGISFGGDVLAATAGITAVFVLYRAFVIEPVLRAEE